MAAVSDVVIVVTVPADTAAGTITNNASVSTSTTDPVAGNDATSEDTTITTSADLSVTKTDSADPVVAGNRVLVHGDGFQCRAFRCCERFAHRRAPARGRLRERHT